MTPRSENTRSLPARRKRDVDPSLDSPQENHSCREFERACRRDHVGQVARRAMRRGLPHQGGNRGMIPFVNGPVRLPNNCPNGNTDLELN
jgi:hypothetical protein